MGNIATPNIIKASDINDLSINSITTSGDITCNGNISVPSGSVTANQYYGRKFKSSDLLLYKKITEINVGDVIPILKGVNFYDFFIFGVYGGNYQTIIVHNAIRKYHSYYTEAVVVKKQYSSVQPYLSFYFSGDNIVVYQKDSGDIYNAYIIGI